MAHIRRHDYLVNLLQAVVETALFYHPAVWWLSRRIRWEREFCVDDCVLKTGPSRADYVRSLMRTAEICRRQPSLSVAATGGHLVARVERILGARRPPGRGRAYTLAVALCLVGIVLGVSAFAAPTSNAVVGADAVIGAGVASVDQGDKPRKKPRKVSPKKEKGPLADTALAKAVDTLNQDARKRPFALRPITVEQIARALRAIKREAAKTDDEYEALQRIAKTGELPEGTKLRQFFRFNDGRQMQHGSWVALIRQRKGYGPFAAIVHKEIVFTRPYTHLERFDRNRLNKSGSITTLNRLVTYFKEKPGFGKQVKATANYDVLVSKVRQVLDAGKAKDFVDLFHWGKSKKQTGLHASVRAEIKAVIAAKAKVEVAFRPRKFTGELYQWQGFMVYGSSLPVEGYIEISFPDSKRAPIRFEAGSLMGKPRLTCYVITKDLLTPRLGKKIPGPITSRGVYVQVNKGSLIYASDVSAPASLPELTEANRELIQLKTR